MGLSEQIQTFKEKAAADAPKLSQSEIEIKAPSSAYERS
jgi:hypothetical protein